MTCYIVTFEVADATKKKKLKDSLKEYGRPSTLNRPRFGMRRGNSMRAGVSL
jgi:hypothetical protein